MPRILKSSVHASSMHDPKESPLLITTRRLEDDFGDRDLHLTNSFYNIGEQMFVGVGASPCPNQLLSPLRSVAIPEKTPVVRSVRVLEEGAQHEALEQQQPSAARKTIIPLSSKRLLSLGCAEPSVKRPTPDTHMSSSPRKKIRAANSQPRTASAAAPAPSCEQQLKDMPAETTHETSSEATQTLTKKTSVADQAEKTAAPGAALSNVKQKKSSKMINNSKEASSPRPLGQTNPKNSKAASSKREPSRTRARNPHSLKLSKAVCGKLSRIARLPGQVTRTRRSELQALVHIGRRSNVAEVEIRRAYGDNVDISRGLRKLTTQGLVVRSGPGGKNHPFVYKLTPAAIGNLREYKKELADDETTRRSWDAKIKAKKKKKM